MPELLSGQAIQWKQRCESFIAEHLPNDKESDASQVIAAAKEAGLYALTQPDLSTPDEARGKQQSNSELTLVTVRETLAASNHPLARLALGPGPGVLAGTTGRLRTEYLQPLMAGEKRGAFAFTEDPDRPQTRAERKGEAIVLNGHKSYVTGGLQADFYNVLAHFDDGAAFVLVDRNTPGLALSEPFESLDGSQHVALTFSDAQLPHDALIGEPGEGLPRALRQIGNVRLAMAAEASGLILWTINWLHEHLSAPHRSGEPLGAREGVRLRYADLRINAFAARSMLYRTARMADSGANVVNEVIATKVFCTELIGRLADEAIQLAGGNALISGHPLTDLYRRVRAMRLAEGASDVLRLNLARGALDLGKGSI